MQLTRRQIAFTIGIVSLWSVLVRARAAPDTAAGLRPAGEDAAKRTSGKGKYMMYVGTYTQGDSKGIYHFSFDPARGTLAPAGNAAVVSNPSFLAISPDRRHLYAVNEEGTFQGRRTGSVSAFSIDPKDGALTLLNQQASEGSGPCHLSLDRQARHVFVANYGAGSIAVLPIESDGRLGQATCHIQHRGASVNPTRQEGPHAHAIATDPTGRFVLSADLGLDRLLIYRFDPAKGVLSPGSPPAAELAPGAGPRHFSFHPGGRFVYVINELNSTVTVFPYDSAHGVQKPIQTITTLPEGYTGSNSPAEIQVHPSGRFVYGSNRGHDSIARFSVDTETGKLRALGHQSTQGKNPRNFAIDPTGNYCIVANQDSGNLVVFRIDTQTGSLTPTEQTVSVPRPVCVSFLPAKR